MAIIVRRVSWLAVLIAVGSLTAKAQQGGTWSNITGNESGTRYSSLDQIGASNFDTLKVAWQWRGATNAGILAASILALNDAGLAKRLDALRAKHSAAVAEHPKDE